MYDSIHNKLYKLPDNCMYADDLLIRLAFELKCISICSVYTGHDYNGVSHSTIGEEKKLNPRLTKTKDEFVAHMAALGLPPPKKLDASVPRNLICGYTE